MTAVVAQHRHGLVLGPLHVHDVGDADSSSPAVDEVVVDEVLSTSNAVDAVVAAGGVADGADRSEAVIDIVQLSVIHIVSNQLLAGGAALGTDVSADALTDAVQAGGDVHDLLTAIDHQAGLTSGQGGALLQVSDLVTGDHALELLHLEGLVSDGVLGISADLIAESEGVVDLLDEDRLTEELGDGLTGSGGAKSAGIDILGDLALVGGSGGLDLPVSAGELAVLVVTDNTQDHGQGLVTGDLVAGIELPIAAALDVLGIGAVVDVTGSPVVRGDVAELVVVSVDLDLGVGDIASGNAVDDGGDLSAGDVSLGGEVRAVVVALEDLQTIEDIDGFPEGFVDLRVV